MDKEIFKKVAKEIGLSASIVEKTYKAYWLMIREYVSSLKIERNMTEEDFAPLRPNINIPSLGKLYLTYDRYLRIKKKFEVIDKIKNKKLNGNTESKED